MGSDQALEFKFVVAKLIVKKQAVSLDDSLSPKGRHEVLKQLSSKETTEMASALESYKLEEYMPIKTIIQPIPKPNDNEQDIWAERN